MSQIFKLQAYQILSIGITDVITQFIQTTLTTNSESTAQLINLDTNLNNRIISNVTVKVSH